MNIYLPEKMEKGTHDEHDKIPSPKLTEETDIPVALCEENIINILIFGETGVGKSTFINSFANYLTFEDLKDAEGENPIVLIPCKFTVSDENYEAREVSIGSDENEHSELGKSCTQEPREYTFPISSGQKMVRLIDTPGIGDSRGIDQDAINCKRIIDFISKFKMIHGIMFLLKSNTTKITVMFEFCIKQILSRLEKSASKNLLFVFTYSKSTDYRPGEILPCLRQLLKVIGEKPPFVNISLSKTNMFCLDNEPFRYLTAKAKGIQFSKGERQTYSKSWEKSAEESWRAIIHIVGDDDHEPLEPHRVDNTVCVNEVRTLISQLQQPVADVTQLIQNNLKALQTHREDLNKENLSLADCKSKLFIPFVDILVEKISVPITVCTSIKCAKVDKKHNITYQKRCHDPCFLKNVSEGMIGAPELAKCAFMKNKICLKCGCNFSTHMQIYYETKTISKTIENDHIKNMVLTKEEAITAKKEAIKRNQSIELELNNELKTIILCVAKFANFLQQNAIAAYNDSYDEYIDYLIDREKSKGSGACPKTINYWKKCQKEYNEAKILFDKPLGMNNQDGTASLTTESVRQSVESLFKLKHTGKTIEELFKSQCQAKGNEDIPMNIDTDASIKNNNKRGLLNQVTTNLRNYFWGPSNQNTVADLDVDNTRQGGLYYKFDHGKYRGWKKWGKKNEK